MFLTGDASQRIYDNQVTLGSLGINIRGRLPSLTLSLSDYSANSRRGVIAAVADGLVPRRMIDRYRDADPKKYQRD